MTCKWVLLLCCLGGGIGDNKQGTIIPTTTMAWLVVGAMLNKRALKSFSTSNWKSSYSALCWHNYVSQGLF